MHTDQTLTILDHETARLGAKIRAFTDTTCPSFDTKELPRETSSRERHILRKAQKQPKSQAQPSHSTSGTNLEQELLGAARARPKTFSLRRYTYHSFGDYADTIRQFGTSDSFSTEPVSTLQYMSVIDCATNYGHRENYSTVFLRLGTSALIERRSLNNWPSSNAVKPGSAASEIDSFTNSQTRLKDNLTLYNSTITLAFPRMNMNISVRFFGTIPATQQPRCGTTK
jgi:hypothetical protein